MVVSGCFTAKRNFKAMDKSWLAIRNKVDERYQLGVDNFLKFAYMNRDESAKIPCPCKKCNNFRDQSKEVAEKHLKIFGIRMSYVRWIYHGESFEDNSYDDNILEEEEEEEGEGDAVEEEEEEEEEEDVEEEEEEEEGEGDDVEEEEVEEGEYDESDEMLNAQARGESGQQPHDGQQHQLDQQEHTPTVTKAKRGPTRNIELANKRLANSNLIVEFDAVSKRIVGRDAQDFISELGCIVRKMARFNKPNFASQDERLKDEIIRKASEGFVYEDGRLARQCINNQLANQFKSHKHALHRIFLQFSSKEKALKHVPTDVIEEDWISLCNHFDSKEYKDMCARNAKNRAKNKTPSTVGSKSLARIIDEKKRDDRVKVTPIDAYKLAHYSKKRGAMINHEAEGTLEKLETLQATTDLSPTEICVQELHSIPGHLRGRSLSTKQILSMEGMQNEIEKQRQRADEANKNAAAMVDKVNAQIEEIKRMNEKTETMMNQLDLLVRMRSKKKCKITQS